MKKNKLIKNFPSFKKTNYFCCCGTILEELAQDEYFRCPKCDIIFEKEQALKIKRTLDISLKDLFSNYR